MARGARGGDLAAPRRAPGLLVARPTIASSSASSSRAPQADPSGPAHDSYLVDSASSHMLVSKIKPCMSKYKQLYSETANGSLYKLSFI